MRKFWGFSSFRMLQEEIVDSVIYGHDTLAVLPTGGGKSVCFQVPGMALEGTTLVISPLIALMQDQVNQLNKKGIKATLITGAMTYREIDIALDNVRFGDVKFLYTSPERLQSPLFIERFKQMNINVIAVDEAHCISEWGHDFRPAFRAISAIREYHPEVPLIALTASATARVQEDIVAQLTLRDHKQFNSSVERPNISYQVIPSENKLKELIHYCKLRHQETGIVYCQTRKSVKEVTQQLRAQRLAAGLYHGGLNQEDRSYMLNEWMEGRLNIMVATNAFGMGIDKGDVRYVLHYEVPASMEAYYQEAGRAGRDGKAAAAIVYWEEEDVRKMYHQLTQKYPPSETIKSLYNAVCNFLTIAIGSGENEVYDFDIQQFSKNYEFPVLTVFNALKILQSNGNISFNERSFHPTRLKFSIGSSALYKFQVSHESLGSLITFLTRSYPGIFERFINLNEAECMQRLKISQQELREKLSFLEQYGVIDLSLQSNQPRITFLHERLPDGHLQIAPEVYLERKKREEQKLASVEQYLSGTTCRSAFIAHYFDTPGDNCGTCDICQVEQQSTYSLVELTKIIPTLLPADLATISNHLNCDKAAVQKAIRTLLLEEKIRFNGEEYTHLTA